MSCKSRAVSCHVVLDCLAALRLNFPLAEKSVPRLLEEPGRAGRASVRNVPRMDRAAGRNANKMRRSDSDGRRFEGKGRPVFFGLRMRGLS